MLPSLEEDMKISLFGCTDIDPIAVSWKRKIRVNRLLTRSHTRIEWSSTTLGEAAATACVPDRSWERNVKCERPYL